MGIGSALQAGVSGLRSQSAKMAAISDNIANSGTVGYRRNTVQFSTLVLNGSQRNSYAAGGVLSNLRSEISRQGAITSGSAATDLAISGDGFFVVADDATGGGGFGLTRAGSFRPDENGLLVNTGGLYLQGFALNPDGTPVAGTPSLDTFDDLVTVDIGAINFAGAATTEVGFSGNIPRGGPGPFQTGLAYFDEFGGAQSLTLNWVQAGPDVWNLEIYDGPVAGAPLAQLAGIDFAAGPSGAPNYAAAAPAGSVTAFDAATGAIDFTLPTGQALTLSIGGEDGFGGVTQFDGDYIPTTTRNGAGFGEVEALEITEDGVLIALFDNGEQLPIYQIPLADVVNPDGLTARNANAYALSSDSGAFRLYAAGDGPVGTIAGAALENSNVDIAEELTSLIETQRAYSSNATVIQTADEMLEEVTRLKR